MRGSLFFPLFWAIILSIWELGVESLRVKISDRKIYRVTPTNYNQLWTLFQLAPLNLDVILWGGPSGVGEPVEFLATPEAMTKFTNSVLSPVNLTAEVVFPFVEISMSTIEPSGTAGEEVIDAEPRNKGAKGTIVQIPGTDLYTGIYYKVSMLRHPTGFMTWTEEMNDYGANFVQIDLTPHNLANYERGQVWDRDAQWMFALTENESWYTWENRVLATNYGGITTWSYKEVGTSGYHVIVSRKMQDVQALSVGGDWRVHALWKPVQVTSSEHNGGKFYQVVNKNFPQGTLTWTELKYGNHSHYVQVDREPKEDYRPGGTKLTDTLFTFTPADLRLLGKISGVQFHQNVETTTQSCDANYTLDNPSSTIYTQTLEENFNHRDQILFTFNVSNFYHLERVVGYFTLPQGVEEIAGFEDEVVLPPDAASVSWSFQKNLNGSKIVEIGPYTAAKVSPCLELMQLKIPFSASMEVRSEGGDLPGEVIKSFLTSEGGIKDYGLVDEVGDYSVLVSLNGTFKGTFGQKVVFLLDTIRHGNSPRICSQVSIKCTAKPANVSGLL